MPIKPVEKKPSKVSLEQAQGGQDKYAQWDEGRYDREGWGLAQFRSPVSEDSVPEPEDPREGKVTKTDYHKISQHKSYVVNGR